MASPAPQANLRRYAERMGWTDVPWYTICSESFSADFGVDEWFGFNVFLRDGDDVYRTYFLQHGAMVQWIGSLWSLWSLTPYGVQSDDEDLPEGWPRASGSFWIRRHDEFEDPRRRPAAPTTPTTTSPEIEFDRRYPPAMEPTQEQIDAYRRDGFLVVERWLGDDEVERVRERFHRCFEHEWETGLAPDEVNYDPATTPARPHAPALQRLEGGPRRWPRPCWPSASRRSARALAGLPGLRLIQDNMIWKPPSGKALLCHQDAAYLEFLDAEEHDHLLDGARRHGAPTPARSSTSAARTTGRAPARAARSTRPDDWLGHVRDSAPDGVELELVPIEVPAGGAAFHDGWTFHGSPPNERADAERRSIISHMVSTDDELERRDAAPGLLALPAPRRDASSTRRSSPCCGAATATAPPSSPPSRRLGPIVRGTPHRRRGEPAAQRRVDGGVVEQREVVRAADAAARPPRGTGSGACGRGRTRSAPARAQSPSTRPTGWRASRVIVAATKQWVAPGEQRDLGAGGGAQRVGVVAVPVAVDQRSVAQVADPRAAAAQEARERPRLGQRVQGVRREVGPLRERGAAVRRAER